MENLKRYKRRFDEVTYPSHIRKEDLVSWSIAKMKKHDTSGIDNPEDYMWYIFKGVYYPYV